ncbi:MAG: carboxymuconolactone decarboxylase family protein [Candidatus Pseudobacter hemicellulosilyticus]|uniref:Carboxymuconolactone decarboxylase family protein n=1 Tax=Candidatus Pseudobacter hemicellulosilyticus TaxID=3121375 RepID=A0AAJ5WQD8_9BACT|nr:MAG: carboxymuconolactone decarboxylase family protein [Pseudobacter sp.]
MEKRINVFNKGQQALKPLFSMGQYVNHSLIEKPLQELLKIRASQLNACAYCLDMHWKDARAAGETEQRLYGLSAWQEAPYYSDRERAALAWTEALTASKMPDAVYQEASRHFSEEELIDLTMVVTTINTWNRINIAFPHAIGSYKVGQFS